MSIAKLKQNILDTVSDRVEPYLKYDGADENIFASIAEEIADPYELKSQEYPTVNGWYWFYGDPFEKDNGHRGETRVYSVKVIHVDGKPRYIADGDFFMNSKPGLWAKAIVPEKPENG